MPLEFIQHLDLPLKWYFGTQKNYNKLETKDRQSLYFLYDTGALYKGDQLFNPSITMYEVRPNKGSTGRIYVNRNTLEGFMYNNNRGWIKVLDEVSDNVDNIQDIIRITGTQLKKYTDGIFKDVTKSSYSDIVYNEDNNTISFIKNGVGIPTPLTGIIKSMDFDLNTRDLSLKDVTGTVIGTVHVPDLYVVSGAYDDNEKAIILKLLDGSSIRFKAYALLNLFNGKNTSTMTSVVENYIDGKNVLSCEVIYSKNLYNALEIKDDGIYANPKTLDNMEEGELYLVQNGYIVPSGINISILATEAYVAQMKEDVLRYFELEGAIYLKRADVLKESFNHTAVSSQVPSMDLINKTVGLRRINQQRRI